MRGNTVMRWEEKSHTEIAIIGNLILDGLEKEAKSRPFLHFNERQ